MARTRVWRIPSTVFEIAISRTGRKRRGQQQRHAHACVSGRLATGRGHHRKGHRTHVVKMGADGSLQVSLLPLWHGSKGRSGAALCASLQGQEAAGNGQDQAGVSRAAPGQLRARSRSDGIQRHAWGATRACNDYGAAAVRGTHAPHMHVQEHGRVGRAHAQATAREIPLHAQAGKSPALWKRAATCCDRISRRTASQPPR